MSSPHSIGSAFWPPQQQRRLGNIMQLNAYSGLTLVGLRFGEKLTVSTTVHPSGYHCEAVPEMTKLNSIERIFQPRGWQGRFDHLVSSCFLVNSTADLRDPLLDGADPLGKGMATHSSILAWRVPRTEEPGRLQSIKLQCRTRLKRLSTAQHSIVSWM